MAGCPYGATVKPGVDPTATLIVDRSTWAQMTGAATTWFDPWLAFLEPRPLKVSDLVAADPDDPPLPLPEVLIAALDPDTLPLVLPELMDYMWKKLTYYEFTQVAVCNGAPGSYCFDQPVMSGASSGYSTATHTYGVDFTNINAGAELTGLRLWDAHFGGGGSSIYLWTTSGTLLHTWTANVCGSGVTDCTLPLTPTYTLAAATTYRIGFDILGVQAWGYHPAGTTSSNPNWTPVDSYASPAGTTGTFPNSPQGGLWWSMGPRVCTTSPTSSPPNASSPTQPTTIIIAPTLSCGTTADLCTAVRQLDQRLTQIYSLVTVIQRHAVPFAYVPGAVHSGITGVGSFPISQLMGLRIQLSATAAGPVLPGNPPYLWNQGWLSINDSQGMLEEKRLTRTGFEWLPTSCRMATSFNYDLADGVVMVVTELEAET
jgi:hypothetical protein